MRRCLQQNQAHRMRGEHQCWPFSAATASFGASESTSKVAGERWGPAAQPALHRRLQKGSYKLVDKQLASAHRY